MSECDSDRGIHCVRDLELNPFVAQCYAKEDEVKAVEKARTSLACETKCTYVRDLKRKKKESTHGAIDNIGSRVQDLLEVTWGKGFN